MTPLHLALIAGWSILLIGFAGGAALGLGFHRSDFLGGYDSWPRRLLRLGHIACAGTGLLCLAYAATAQASGGGSWLAAWALAAGAATMPSVCLAAALWKPARHAFPLPVVCLATGAATALIESLP